MSSSLKSKLIKPKRLPAGGTIGVTAPATMPDPEKLERGIRYFEKLGYRLKIGKTCTTKLHYLAGDDEMRARELESFFADPDVDIIICARGGYGGMHLLPLLDFDIIRRNPKLLVGYSDITSLHWAFFAQCGLIGLSGPMVASDFGAESLNTEMEKYFWEFMETGELDISFGELKNIEVHHTLGISDEITNLNSAGNHSPNANKSEGIKTKSLIEGTLIPATLAVAAKQMGSPFFPNLAQAIPVFEDIDEPAHKIEGYLRQFSMAGHFDQIEVILFGDFSPPAQEDETAIPPRNLIFSRVLGKHGISYISGIRYGHIPDKISLPAGAPISLSFEPEIRLRTKGSIFEN